MVNPGAVIAVAAWGAFAGVIAWCALDGSRRLEELRWKVDERRAKRDLRAYGGALSRPAAFTEAELEEIERFRCGAAFAEAMALQLAEIRGLPETVDTL